MKSRRRSELAAEKKEKMTTGGGQFKTVCVTDEGIDVLNSVDIELKTGGVDSDTVEMAKSGTSEEFVLKGDVLVPVCADADNSSCDLVEQEIDEDRYPERSQEQVPESKGSPAPVRKRRFTSRDTAIERELECRIKRNKVMEEHENELHKLREAELQIKLETAEIERTSWTTR